MKKIPLIALLLISICAYTQPNPFKPHRYSTVTAAYPTEWTIDVPKTVTTYHNPKPVGTVLGATAGYLLTGGLLGTVAGGVAGHSIAGEERQVTTTVIEKLPMKGYLTIMSDGESFRTIYKFSKGQTLDTSKLTKY